MMISDTHAHLKSEMFPKQLLRENSSQDFTLRCTEFFIRCNNILNFNIMWFSWIFFMSGFFWRKKSILFRLATSAVPSE